MSEIVEPNPCVGEAIDLIGGDTAVAKLLGIRAWAVSKWRTKLPDDRALWLAEQTGWQYTPHNLRPSMYPNPTDGLPPSRKRILAKEMKRRASDAATPH